MVKVGATTTEKAASVPCRFSVCEQKSYINSHRASTTVHSAHIFLVSVKRFTDFFSLWMLPSLRFRPTVRLLNSMEASLNKIGAKANYFTGKYIFLWLSHGQQVRTEWRMCSWKVRDTLDEVRISCFVATTTWRPTHCTLWSGTVARKSFTASSQKRVRRNKPSPFMELSLMWVSTRKKNYTFI